MPAVRWVFFAALVVSCKPRITQKECDALIDRYADLLVRENAPDAPPDVVADTKAQVKKAAEGTVAVKNCEEVRRPAFHCAMSAATTDDFEECLE